MTRERIPITREGLEALRREYEYLVKHRRPEIARVIQEAREHGDIRENAAYDAAKHDQAFIEGRIREIEELLKRVELIEEPTDGDRSVVRVGSTVTIEIDGEIETYTIVGAIEAKPSAGRISNESPVGKALLGRRVGDSVMIDTPNGQITARILEVS
ncbi:transcription elongation factor GreA [Thermomicrobium sp. CFH 73360]|uniref:transcription elongation factor GreA n=1 Tax=Thermomicrobium sp. CFH 73360 TaxID=2951987 RepID=UPI002076A596|nr:transcription elongation factor GreA [Thermomicrobium sp. CFH 73360]MCM8744965.1 transcription elongation factor GreA [Thermomicrobium sp. CFH 73360]